MALIRSQLVRRWIGRHVYPYISTYKHPSIHTYIHTYIHPICLHRQVKTLSLVPCHLWMLMVQQSSIGPSNLSQVGRYTQCQPCSSSFQSPHLTLPTYLYTVSKALISLYLPIYLPIYSIQSRWFYWLFYWSRAPPTKGQAHLHYPSISL